MSTPVASTPSPVVPLPLSWDRAFELYEDYLHTRRTAHSTITSHRRTLRRLRQALSAQARDPAGVRLDDLRRYQLSLLRKRLAPSTVSHATGHIRSFFGFLFLDELTEKNPAARLAAPRVPPRPPGVVFSTKEVQLLLEAAGSGKDPLIERALLEVLYCTGVRRAELLALDLFDIDHRERTLLVRAGKGDKPRVLPITPMCYDALHSYLEYGRPDLERRPTEALFLGPRGARFGQIRLMRVLHRLGERAGLTKRVTPHCFRRSCATGLLKNGTNLRVIQAILGHSNLETTSVYLCLNPEEIRN
ncbi:tyrosine-type recombinase/integrase, partial [Planctomycetota bacterium]|nr:tyrosine-type recombinase/integrase [Planctomycetota bacterium]